MKALFAFILAVFVSNCSGGEKKLIEFGWDEPGAEFMRDHAAEMDASPFDGCVFHVLGADPASGAKQNFTWECWGTKKFTKENVQPEIDALKAAKLKRMKHNFVRFNATPAKIDWFDDHSIVIENAALAAYFARETKCDGILFDIEQYDGQPFNYRKQRDSKDKGWEAYAAQARKRGREVMEAFQGKSDITILLTFGHSLPWVQSGAGKRSLADCDYGLLAPFLDGMLEACRGKSRLVDGNELAYAFKEQKQFDRSLAEMRTDLVPVIVADPRKYTQYVSMSFGLWMDHDWRKKAWDETDFSKNHFTPEEFEKSLRYALQQADEYVWIYTETPRWWSKEGKTVKLPKAYDDAVRKAHPRK